MDHRLGRVGQRPLPRPAVPGALHPDSGTVLGRGHREVSGLRDDPGDRPGLCPQAGPGVRREGLRRDRGRAGTAARGDRYRPGAGEADHRCLGRAEGGPRDHGVPAQPRRRHGTGGAHIQDLRRRRRGSHDGEPVPARPRHPRHRLRDRRRDRDEARDREDGHGPGPRGHRLCPDRSDGRGPLRAAGRGTGTAGGQAPGGARRPDPDRTGAGIGRRHGGRRHG